MVLTTVGKSGIALLLSPSGIIPQFCGIGSGSGAVDVNRTGLIAEVLGSRPAFTTREIGTERIMEWTWDFSSTTMSGLDLREFVVSEGSEVKSGTAFSVEGFGSIVFDGTNEAQINVKFEIF